MLTRIPLHSNLFVHHKLVNCTPWSVLKIFGFPLPRASSNISMQNHPSNVFDKDQAITKRLYQSMIAAKYM